MTRPLPESLHAGSVVPDQRAGPAGWDTASARRAVHPRSGRSRADGLIGQHDDARRARVLPFRPHRRPHRLRPGRLRAAAEGASRGVPHQGLDRLELIRFLQVAQTISVHHGALAYLLGINALRASEAAAVRIQDYADTLRGYRVLHLVGKGNKRATMPSRSRCSASWKPAGANGPLVLRPVSGNPIDRRDAYRMVNRIAKTAGIPRHISPHSLRHAAITNALDAGVPLRDAQILARHADPPNHRALRPRPRQPRPTRRALPHRIRRRRLTTVAHQRRLRPLRRWCPRL